MPTPEVLWSKFDLDPSEGVLIWKPIPSIVPAKKYTQDWHANMWNGRYAGKPVIKKRTRRGGSRASIQVMVGGIYYFAHRIIWVMCNGRIPDGPLIDHINRDPWDNRIENLRLATHSQNRANMNQNTNTLSGLRGVTLGGCKNRWVARICVDGVTMNLGTYDRPEEAYARYCEVAKGLHGEFFNG